MKKILKVCQRDFKNILYHPIALIITIGVLILPALYAWINIKASWDPYANTAKIAVAIVNKDKGTTFEGEVMNVGDEVVSNLKGNDKIGWQFVSSEEADKGLLEGDYYAAIEITESFSEDLLSVISDHPIKPQLIYKVDAKANPVAIKIAGASETSIVEEITKSFIYEANEKLFEKANKVGTLLTENQSHLFNLKDMIISLNQKMDLIIPLLESAEQGVDGLEKYLKTVQQDIKKLTTFDSELQNLIANKERILQSKDKILAANLDYLSFNRIYINDSLQTIEDSLTEALNHTGEESYLKNRDFITGLIDQVDLTESFIDTQINFLGTLPISQDSHTKLGKMITDLKLIKEQLELQEDKLRVLRSNAHLAEINETSALKELQDIAQKNRSAMATISNGYNEMLKTQLNSLNTQTTKALEEASKFLEETQRLNNALEGVLDRPIEASGLGESITVDLAQQLKDYKEMIEMLSSTLQGIDNEELVNLILLLQSSPKTVGDFMAQPVEVVENPVYPIPNYGSAMAPIYTVLAMWVGGLILMALMSTKVKDREELRALSVREKYFGKLLTFIILSVIQSVIIVLGNIYILGVYTSNKLLFLLFGVIGAITFMTIIYTFVANFGNVGKALAIIGLILQVAGSGGSYPIQVDPKIFRIIQPYFPFTYAIGGIREAIGGPLATHVFIDITVLIIMTSIFILLGYFFYGKIAPFMEGLAVRFRESGIAEEE